MTWVGGKMNITRPSFGGSEKEGIFPDPVLEGQKNKEYSQTQFWRVRKKGIFPDPTHEATILDPWGRIYYKIPHTNVGTFTHYSCTHKHTYYATSDYDVCSTTHFQKVKGSRRLLNNLVHTNSTLSW